VGTIVEVTLPDGYKIRAFSSMYMDYGLEIIAPDGKEYYNASCLCCDSYGFYRNDDDEVIGEWSKDTWKEMMLSEADCFIEAYMWDPEYFED